MKTLSVFVNISYDWPLLPCCIMAVDERRVLSHEIAWHQAELDHTVSLQWGFSMEPNMIFLKEKKSKCNNSTWMEQKGRDISKMQGASSSWRRSEVNWVTLFLPQRSVSPSNGPPPRLPLWPSSQCISGSSPAASCGALYVICCLPRRLGPTASLPADAAAQSPVGRCKRPRCESRHRHPLGESWTPGIYTHQQGGGVMKEACRRGGCLHSCVLWETDAFLLLFGFLQLMPKLCSKHIYITATATNVPNPENYYWYGTGRNYSL